MAILAADGFRHLSRAAETGATLSLPAGESVTFRTVISLQGALFIPAKDEEVMRIGIGTTAIGAGSFARLYFTPDGNVTLFNSDVKSPVGLPIATSANELLAIDTTFHVGATAGTSSTSHRLSRLDSNLNTIASSIVGTRAGWNDTLFNLLTAGVTGIGAYRQTTWSSARTGINSITMHSTQVVSAFQNPITSKRYDLWAERMGLSGAMADPHADPRGVGVSNLLRYAFDMDLDKINQERLPRFQLFPGANGQQPRPGLSFYAIDSQDINFKVEVSTDLKTWQLLPESSMQWETQATDAGLQEVKVQDLNAPTGANRFYRLRVETVP
jgi:hypothetical protein